MPRRYVKYQGVIATDIKTGKPYKVFLNAFLKNSYFLKCPDEGPKKISYYKLRRYYV